MEEQRSPKPQAGGSSPPTPARVSSVPLRLRVLVRKNASLENTESGKTVFPKRTLECFPSLTSILVVPRWWNWQTRCLEGAVDESPWEFKSPPRHQH